MIDLTVLLFTILFGTQTIIFYIILRSILKVSSENFIRYCNSIIEEISRIKELVEKNHRYVTTSDEASTMYENISQEEFNETCYKVLEILMQDGPSSSLQISSKIGRSREHVSRLLKNLYVKGFVSRVGKPYNYVITDKGISFLNTKQQKR